MLKQPASTGIVSVGEHDVAHCRGAAEFHLPPWAGFAAAACSVPYLRHHHQREPLRVRRSLAMDLVVAVLARKARLACFVLKVVLDEHIIDLCTTHGLASQHAREHQLEGRSVWQRDGDLLGLAVALLLSLVRKRGELGQRSPRRLRRVSRCSRLKPILQRLQRALDLSCF